MKCRLWFLHILQFIGLCIVLAVFLAAQDTVRATVSVAGQSPAPITNLTKNDFSVKDAGKPRTLTAFTAPDVKKPAPEKLKANEYSNFPDLREADGAIFVVLDTVHTPYTDERDARMQILKFLAKAAQAKNRAGCNA